MLFKRFFRAHGFRPTREADQKKTNLSLADRPLLSRNRDEAAIPGKEATKGGPEQEEAANDHGEEQEEAQDEGTSSNNITRQESESVITVEHGNDKEQAGALNDDKGDDHASARHEAAIEVISEKTERKESGYVKNNDENSCGEVNGQTVENVDDSKSTAEGNNEETDNSDVNDKEGNEQVEDNKEASEESSGEESKDKESVKEESSGDHGSEDRIPDRDTSGVYEKTESVSEGTATTQESMTVLGLCPPDTKEGDFICILLGCSVPGVLRETPDKRHMILIGEAYVHGKMDGEAMEDTHRALETFSIK
ncbi:hypothetical protein FOXB_09554 [Fusarium oxysporum f. sp. conglutinans Fo5176]|uniref:Uncharacterized protein n=1 Tax=Fusarium oxysporum (strain Fo5176) TaxID=660025 RepID=F9FT23_FUSOF|nr:hypothetical protein FOXB_09554 [Fusarium oxysporum f. sp. conglutinans Fo5176]